jgi:hypothetical protein
MEAAILAPVLAGVLIQKEEDDHKPTHKSKSLTHSEFSPVLLDFINLVWCKKSKRSILKEN